MQQFTNGTNQEFRRDASNDGALTAKEAWDLEKVLSLADIRAHTKTDDVPAVTDMQLRLYRKAAFEAAQEYTGLLFMGQRIITEDVYPPQVTQPWEGRVAYFTHRLQYAIAQNFLWYYGLKSLRPQRVPMLAGATEVKLQRQMDSFGLGCCNPSGESHAKILYVAGYGCEEDLPATLLLGVLKYVAHVVENPGDLVVAQNIGGARADSVGAGQAANPAWASGAIEMWRTLKKDAV